MAIRMKNGVIAAAIVAASLAAVPASAQLFLSQPDLRASPIDPSEPLVGLPIPGATAAEYRANLLWNLRAGLNVAALQCQFSDYLRAVPNYNGLLAHHSVELSEAYATLNNYYKRTLGAKGQKALDDYSTMTYNNWSSAQAQQIFCQTATNITKTALATPKGQLITVAVARMRELRNALVPAYDPRPAYRPYLIRFKDLPPLAAECYNKKGLLRRLCGGNAK
ncbi:MAG: hypothetical protein QOJ91_1254 [Sphingomonadales bacterium]|jgi:hypothetical protein|nr:hypothetical protein [Sphingomonadales bacterium]